MAINKKLFYLGNDVVILRQVIEECFPVSSGGPISQQNTMRQILVEMLRMINIIRIESYNGETSKKKYQLQVVCDEDEIKKINSFIEEQGVEFDVLDLETGRYGRLDSESE